MKRYVAIAVTAGAFAVAVGSGAAAPPPEIELVWGSGAPPAYAATPAHPATTGKHGSIVESAPVQWRPAAVRDRPGELTPDRGGPRAIAGLLDE